MSLWLVKKKIVPTSFFSMMPERRIAPDGAVRLPEDDLHRQYSGWPHTRLSLKSGLSEMDLHA
jgi:hypothetical protein